jgi:predicted ATPase
MHLRADLQGCAWLVRLLPELADGPIEPLPARALLPAQERRLTFEAVGHFLANVGGPSGTLLILDDLQWAGVDALDLLMALAGTRNEARLRIVGAYRDTEVAPRDPLGVALADLAHGELAVQHTLKPLDARSAEALLDELLMDREQRASASWQTTRDRVLRRAGGVPFYLVSFAQGLRTGGDFAADSLPWDVRQGLQQRLASLPVTAQELLGVASIAGRVAERPLLANASTLPESDLAHALDTACAARLLETASPGAYQFPHDVVREVIEASLGPAQRVLLHRTMAVAIECVYADRLPEQYEALAMHCVRGEVWYKALDYLVKAGDKAAAAYANQRALDVYARAYEVCFKVGASARATAVAVARKRGFINFILGRVEDAGVAFDHMGTAAQLVGDRHAEALALSHLGMSRTMNHAFDAAELDLNAALKIAEEGYDDVRFAAGVWLGGSLTSTDRDEEGLAILLPIEEVGIRVGDQFNRA